MTIGLEHVTIHGNRVGHRSGGYGDVVVLIHGMVSSSETWEPVLPALARSMTVVAPDLLGHGASAKPRGDYSLGAQAASVRDLLVALGHERATIVGHSLGGGIAMQFAYQFPERCERLVLVGAGGLGREVNPLLRALSVPGAEYALALACGPKPIQAGAAVTNFFARLGLRPTRALAEMMRNYGSLVDGESRTAFLHTLRAVVDVGGQRVCANDRLYLVEDIPTLLVWGDRDAFIPVAHARAAHAVMPGSRLEIFEGAGHFPHREMPERFASVLDDFVTSTAPAVFTEQRLRERLRAQPA